MDNIVLQSQVTEVMDENDALITKLDVVLGNLSKVQLDYQISYDAYRNEQENLESTRLGLEHVLSSFYELKEEFTDIKGSNSHLLGLYSTVWEKYADLIIAYNNLTIAELVGEMVTTEISGVVNSGFDDGGEGWVMQGVGGKTPYAHLHQSDSGSYATQTIQYNDTDTSIGLSFLIKPEPVGAEVQLEVSFGGYLIYAQTFAGLSSGYDWELIVLPLEPLFTMRTYYGFDIADYYTINFCVPAGEENGARVLIDDVSLVSIEFEPEEPKM